MGARQFKFGSTSLNQGIVDVEFSFMTNGTGQPTVGPSSTLVGNTARGEGVLSAVRQSTGNYLVNLDWGFAFREVVCKTADLDDSNGDGRYGSCGNVLNEGTVTPLSLVVYTRAASGALTDFGTGGTAAASRISVFLTCKNSAVGK